MFRDRRRLPHQAWAALIILAITGPGIVLNLWPSPPPQSTLTINKGELVDTSLIRPRKGEAWLRIRLWENGKLTASAIRYYYLLAPIADLRSLASLPRGTPVTISTAPAYWFDRVSDLPDVWEMDARGAALLTYAESSQAWRAHKQRGAIGFAILAALALLVIVSSTWLSKRTTRKSAWPRSPHYF